MSNISVCSRIKRYGRLAGLGIMLVVTNVDCADAFDGKREGVVVGAGVGVGELFKYRSSPYLPENNNTGSIQSKFVFGAGITESSMLLISLEQFWYSGELFPYSFTDDGILLGYTLGARKYFQTTAPSLYIEGGMGFGVAANRRGGRFLSLNGTRISVPMIKASAGYEFVRHLSVDFEALYTWIDENSDATWRIGLKVNALAY